MAYGLAGDLLGNAEGYTLSSLITQPSNKTLVAKLTGSNEAEFTLPALEADRPHRRQHWVVDIVASGGNDIMVAYSDTKDTTTFNPGFIEPTNNTVQEVDYELNPTSRVLNGGSQVFVKKLADSNDCIVAITLRHAP